MLETAWRPPEAATPERPVPRRVRAAATTPARRHHRRGWDPTPAARSCTSRACPSRSSPPGSVTRTPPWRCGPTCTL